MFKRLKLAFVFFLFSANIFAQVGDGEWSLTKCIEFARENNITVKQLQLNIESAQSQLTQSWAGLAPTVNGSASHTWNYGLSFDNNSGLLNDQQYQSSFFVTTASWILFNGLSNYYSIMANKWGKKVATYDFEQAINDVELNVAQLYLQLLFAEERLLIIQEQVAAWEKQVERTKLMYETGLVTKGDYLGAESQLATQLINLANGENAVELAKLALIQGLNLDANDIKIEKPDFSNVKIEEFDDNEPLEAIYNYAIDNTPGIKSKRANVWQFKRNLAVARGAYYPSLTFNASLQTTFSELRKDYTDPFNPIDIPYGEQLRQNFGQQLSFRIDIPIFNGLQTRTNVKLAKVQWENSKLDLQNQINTLKNTIQQAYTDAKAAYRTYTANKLNLSALEETYNYAKDRFEVGLMNSVDFNDAANNYYNARTELLISQYDYILKTKVLDFYKGKKLEF